MIFYRIIYDYIVGGMYFMCRIYWKYILFLKMFLRDGFRGIFVFCYFGGIFKLMISVIFIKRF